MLNQVNDLSQRAMGSSVAVLESEKPPINIPAVTFDLEDCLKLVDLVETLKGESRQADLSLAQFVEDFGSGLMRAVRSQNPPVFTGETKPEREAILAALKRKLFAAQANAVHAAATLLLDHEEKSVIINGEMGCGKTAQGIALAALLHAEGLPRALVLSPPHLVYKWRREILDMLPEAEVVILNGADTLRQLQAMRQTAAIQPKHPVFYILGRVRLRLGHHWRVVVRPRLATTILRTTQDRQEPEVGAHIGKQQRLASCPHCAALVKSSVGLPLLVEHMPTDKKKSCQSCGSPLWTQIHPGQTGAESEQNRSAVMQTLCRFAGNQQKTGGFFGCPFWRGFFRALFE